MFFCVPPPFSPTPPTSTPGSLHLLVPVLFLQPLCERKYFYLLYYISDRCFICVCQAFCSFACLSVCLYVSYLVVPSVCMYCLPSSYNRARLSAICFSSIYLSNFSLSTITAAASSVPWGRWTVRDAMNVGQRKERCLVRAWVTVKIRWFG